MKKKIKNVTVFIVILILAIIIVGSIYYYKEYPKQDFDLILFTLFNGVEYAAPGVVNSILVACVIPVILLFVILYVPTIRITKSKVYLYVKLKNKQKRLQIYPINIINKHRVIYIILIFIIALITFMKCFRVDSYVKSKMQNSRIFEEYYVDARDVKIEFPEEKRNLIIIIAESMETTVCSKENGGGWDYSIIPELEQIAIDNTNFSNTNKLGGAIQTHGSDYSAGGNVAITAGIPLKTVDILSDKNIYQGNGEYLSGAYTLRRSAKR